MTLPAITHPLTQNIGCTRLSTAAQEDAYGQEAQESDIRTYAKKYALPLSGIVHEVISGATVLEDRSVIQDYYKLAKKHKGLDFIFPRVDRLGRLAERIITIARELCDLDARVYVVGFEQPLNPKEPNWLMFQFKALMAEQAYVGLIEQMAQGRVQKAMRGLWPHGRPPYGYDVIRDDKGRSLTLTPSPTEAPAVQRLFEIVVQHGKVKAAEMMRAEGWPAPTEAAWGPSTIYNITKNTRYLGRATFKGVPFTFPALVTREQFDLARQVIAERRNNHAPPKQRNYFLTGLVRCHACGHAMSHMNINSWQRQKTGEGEIYRYYRCWDAAYGTLHVKCTHKKNYRADGPTGLEARAWDAFTAAFASPEALALYYAPPVAEMPDHHTRLGELKEQMAQAFGRAVALNIPDDVLSLTLKPLQTEAARLEREMNAVQPAPTVDLSAKVIYWSNILAGQLSQTERREILEATLARFSVAPDGIQLLSLNLPTV